MPRCGRCAAAEDTGGPDAAARWEGRIRELTAARGRHGLRDAVTAYAAANWSWERCSERYAELLRQITLKNDARR